MILVTWRLRGSLRHKPRCASATAVDRMLDRAPGEKLELHDARSARIVRDTLLMGQRELRLYALQAWVMHHNHVHVLLQANAGTVHIAETLMDASEAAAGRQFWERESYERVIQNGRECDEAVRFIEQHPVKLGLVDHPADWQWSSAFAAGARNPQTRTCVSRTPVPLVSRTKSLISMLR